MTQSKPSPLILFPQISLPDELASALPLEHTAVAAHITGPTASVTVTQRFGNPIKELAEVDYLFPLPENAAITAFELKVGARKIEGELQALETARQAFDTAREQGRRAGMLEQRRPNLFSARLTNLRPGETVEAVMRYQQRLKFEDDSYEFVFPMGLTPKYDSPAQADEGKGVHAPVAQKGEKIGPVEISVSVDAGMPLAGDPRSPSHPIEITALDERRFVARAAGEPIPDHDFVLRWAAAGDAFKAGAWISAREGGEVFLATLVPPRLEDDMTAEPREFVFVLDRSGSMSGPPIYQARNALLACIRTLNPEDTFRLLLFDDMLEWYRDEPVRLNQQELDLADAYIARIEGRGGTEIVGAIEAALNLPEHPGRARFIVFLTDGAVSAEERALNQIRGKIGSSRLFTFGVGSSVNRALLTRMARMGRGRAEFLQLNEDIEGAIIRFQDSVSFPMLTNVTAAWEHGKAWDVYPARIGDLYAGQTVEICGRLQRDQKGSCRLVVKGTRAGDPVELAVDLLPVQGREPAIERAWARERIDDLSEQQAVEPSKAGKLRDEIIALALEHKIVTEFTAFVAVDTQAAAEGGAKPKVIHVAQPLPQGVTFGMAPSGPVFAAAMPAMLRSAPPPTPASGNLLHSVSSFISSKIKGVRDSDASFTAGASAPQPESMAPGGPVSQPVPDASDREHLLRWLARSQRVDGSWDGSVERTAAALLAFARAGHTTRAGSYRQALRKAVKWLSEAQAAGFEAALRWRALDELARATGEEKDHEAAREAKAGLGQGASSLERAALGEGAAKLSVIASLDDLRLAALSGQALKAPDALLKGKDAAIAATWAAGL